MSSGHSSAGDGAASPEGLLVNDEPQQKVIHCPFLFFLPVAESHILHSLIWLDRSTVGGQRSASLSIRGLMTIFWELVENRQIEIQVKPKPKRKDTDMHHGWGFYDGVRPALGCCFSSTNKQCWSFFSHHSNQTSIPAKTSVSDPATISPSVRIITNMLRSGR